MESTYEQCLARELKLSGICFLSCSIRNKSQYKGVKLDCGYRVDLLVEDKLIISGRVVSGDGYYTPKLKSVEQIKGFHQAQLLSYMKLTGVKTGLLMNFNVARLTSGIKRFVL